MSGPKPPVTGSGADETGTGEPAPGESGGEAGGAGAGGELVGTGRTAETEAYSQAYSAPESAQFSSGPYVPVDPRLYDYDSFDVLDEPDADVRPPRWPWVVGVTTIIAAIALVVSVALLFARTETNDLATPATITTTTRLLPPVQDEITTTASSPSPTSESTEEPPPPPSPTETPEPSPSPAEVAPAPAPEPTATTPVTTTTPAGPRQVTYSVTGSKAPFDQITITYIDASGQRRTQRNAYIPWSLTLTPISQSEVGSVEASSLLRLSKLNCSITSSDGAVLSASSNDAPQTSC